MTNNSLKFRNTIRKLEERQTQLLTQLDQITTALLHMRSATAEEYSFEVHFQADDPKIFATKGKGDQITKAYKKAVRKWHRLNRQNGHSAAEVFLIAGNLRIPLDPIDAFNMSRRQMSVDAHFGPRHFCLDPRMHQTKVVWPKRERLPGHHA